MKLWLLLTLICIVSAQMMKFKVLETLAEKNLKSGSWKPIFKMRYNNTYMSMLECNNEYESDLRNRIYGIEYSLMIVMLL